jgi:glutathione synthase/RimK-type ligase-like ATP-grasp enzyme
MKIGIHEQKGSFSDYWIAYCIKNSIKWKSVNCYATDILNQLEDCDALMWHFNHKSPKASKFAKQLLFSIQASGKSVFPNYNTVWHFDDKVGQKYLLESLKAPLVPVYIFYSKKDAIEWSNQTTFPKVFKLRNGAGSDNVRLVKSKREALNLINIAFSKGFKQYDALKNLKERYRKYKLGKTSFRDLLKGVIRLVYTTDYARMTDREIGYVYFQDFIPNNDYDIRIIVIGEKAFGIKRMVRKNDFRASGSGNIYYEKQHFGDETVGIAFDISKRLKSQCTAFDFVYDNKIPLIVEISYGFSPEGYNDCTGYWDSRLNWHEGTFDPYGWMVEMIIAGK